MTLILGISDPVNDRAILCCDSGQWYNELRQTATRSKVWASGRWAAATSGNTWVGNIARRVEFPLSDSAESAQDYADSVMRAIGERQVLVSKVDKEDVSCSIVIAAGSKVYHGGADFGLVSPVSGVVARGYGNEFAVGAALALAKHVSLDALATCENVMRLAEVHTAGCSGPFWWFATDGTAGRWV